MGDEGKYDWASAIAAIVSNPSSNFVELAKVAQLDPLGGDFSDADFSDLDLSNQNLSGWDLRNAKFANALLTRTEMRNAKLNPSELIDAINWEEANLDDDVRAAASEAAASRSDLLSRAVEGLEISVRTTNCLRNAEIKYLGQLVQKSEHEMLRVQDFGRKSLQEIRDVLAPLGLHLGMDIKNWSPNR
jgi:hypothetical protein